MGDSLTARTDWNELLQLPPVRKRGISEDYAKTKNDTNHYNIEIKSSPKNDGKTYSSVEEFVALALKIIKDKKIESRTTLHHLI